MRLRACSRGRRPGPSAGEGASCQNKVPFPGSRAAGGRRGFRLRHADKSPTMSALVSASTGELCLQQPLRNLGQVNQAGATVLKAGHRPSSRERKAAGNDHSQTPRSGRRLGEGWLWLPTPCSLRRGEDLGCTYPPGLKRQGQGGTIHPSQGCPERRRQPAHSRLGTRRPICPSAQGRGCIANGYTASSRNPCDLPSGSGGLRSEPGGR